MMGTAKFERVLFDHEQEFFNRLSLRLQRDLQRAGINTVHDLGLIIQDGKIESEEITQALQGINYVFLRDLLGRGRNPGRCHERPGEIDASYSKARKS
jgi:hypothetical protein